MKPASPALPPDPVTSLDTVAFCVDRAAACPQEDTEEAAKP